MMNKEKIEEIWFSHAKNPRQFPGFTVVVVTFLLKILDDFHDFVSECVSSRGKSTTRVGLTVFPMKSDIFHWT